MPARRARCSFERKKPEEKLDNARQPRTGRIESTPAPPDSRCARRKVEALSPQLCGIAQKRFLCFSNCSDENSEKNVRYSTQRLLDVVCSQQTARCVGGLRPVEFPR